MAEQKWTRESVRAGVELAYARLERASERSQETDRLLDLAFSAALSSEQEHRKGSWVRPRLEERQRQPAAVCAKFYVLRWVHEEPDLRERSARDWAGRRLEVLYCSALRQALDDAGSTPIKPEVAALAYEEHFASMTRNSDGSWS
jgi:hypothetical protein